VAHSTPLDAGQGLFVLGQLNRLTRLLLLTALKVRMRLVLLNRAPLPGLHARVFALGVEWCLRMRAPWLAASHVRRRTPAGRRPC
jgi:hypothetical protein